jgi:hypothetical protein
MQAKNDATALVAFLAAGVTSRGQQIVSISPHVNGYRTHQRNSKKGTWWMRWLGY